MTTRFTVILTVADKERLTRTAAKRGKTFSQHVRSELGISQVVTGKKKVS